VVGISAVAKGNRNYNSHRMLGKGQQKLTCVHPESPFSFSSHTEWEFPQRPSAAPMLLLHALFCEESLTKLKNCIRKSCTLPQAPAIFLLKMMMSQSSPTRTLKQKHIKFHLSISMSLTHAHLVNADCTNKALAFLWPAH
jgi:hypothetical protein